MALVHILCGVLGYLALGYLLREAQREERRHARFRAMMTSLKGEQAVLWATKVRDPERARQAARDAAHYAIEILELEE